MKTTATDDDDVMRAHVRVVLSLKPAKVSLND